MTLYPFGTESQTATAAVSKPAEREPYGVFLSIDNSDLSKLDKYEIVVIDAQYFSKEDIDKLHAEGHTVYSYLNVGAVENFRDYFSNYKSLFLGEYENWEEEQWVDVSDEEWQAFIAVRLAGELSRKGVDGFFVDNCDVYYNFPSTKIFNGMTNILRGLMKYDKAVIINGGDRFVDEYYNKSGSVSDILTGINQETVFSAIDFESEKLTKQIDKEREHYQRYITKYSQEGADIYLLEYTTNQSLAHTIQTYCTKKQFKYYISDSIELD
ncbi:endo alpha-1,4 polygalactosaminidase [Facklamia miroungae]